MHPLTIAPYDPQWALDFATAVPGLPAKPVIDIQVSVRALQPIAAYEQCLAALGYRHVPHAEDSVCPFFYRPHAWPHTLTSMSSRRVAAVTDAADRDARERYSVAKTGFIAQVVARALAAATALRCEPHAL